MFAVAYQYQRKHRTGAVCSELVLFFASRFHELHISIVSSLAGRRSCLWEFLLLEREFNCWYDDIRDVSITINVYEKNSMFPTDFRTKEEIIADSKESDSNS